jgi:hypothetical protein
MSLNALILVNYLKGTADTIECLDSLTKAAGVRNQVIIVVHVGSEKDRRILERHALKPHVYHLSLNLGFSGANNFGIKEALKRGASGFILLNNDTIVDPDFLAPLLAQMENKTVGLVSPKIYFYPGCEFHRDSYAKAERGKVIWYAGGVVDWENMYTPHRGVDEVDHGQFEEVEETDFATGCCVGVSALGIQKIGFLNEAFFLSWEDVDWSMRAKNNGLKILYEPKSIIWHKNAQSSGGSGSKTQRYYQTRNRLFFGLRYAPWRTRLALVKESLGKFRYGTIDERRAIGDVIRRHDGEK